MKAMMKKHSEKKEPKKHEMKESKLGPKAYAKAEMKENKMMAKKRK